MDYQTILYKEAKNGTVEWKVVTDGNKIIVSEGLIHGKKRVHERIVTGKNKGRKNETTDIQQTILEAQSKWKNKYNSGYRPANEDKNINIRKENETLCPISPILAQQYEKGKPIFPAYSQPKLDGVRCVTEYKNDKVNLYSRGMIQYYFLNHIREELKVLFEHLKPNEYFDGELFSRNLGFQEIQSITRQEKQAHKREIELEYHIFDIVDIHTVSNPFKERYERLKECFNSHRFIHIKLVPTIVVENETKMYEQHKQFEEDGYEGLILRNSHLQYPKTPKYRSKDLLKVKSWYDDEAEIIGYSLAKGNQKGAVIWEVKKDDMVFSVTPKATISERRNMADNAKDYIGSILTYKYQDTYDEGKPKFAIGHGFRNAKDLPS